MGVANSPLKIDSKNSTYSYEERAFQYKPLEEKKRVRFPFSILFQPAPWPWEPELNGEGNFHLDGPIASSQHQSVPLGQHGYAVTNLQVPAPSFDFGLRLLLRNVVSY